MILVDERKATEDVGHGKGQLTGRNYPSLISKFHNISS